MQLEIPNNHDTSTLLMIELSERMNCKLQIKIDRQNMEETL